MVTDLRRMIKTHLHSNTSFISTINTMTKFVQENLGRSQTVTSHQHRVCNEVPAPVPT